MRHSHKTAPVFTSPYLLPLMTYAWPFAAASGGRGGGGGGGLVSQTFLHDTRSFRACVTPYVRPAMQTPLLRNASTPSANWLTSSRAVQNTVEVHAKSRVCSRH